MGVDVELNFLVGLGFQANHFRNPDFVSHSGLGLNNHHARPQKKDPTFNECNHSINSNLSGLGK